MSAFTRTLHLSHVAQIPSFCHNVDLISFLPFASKSFWHRRGTFWCLFESNLETWPLNKCFDLQILCVIFPCAAIEDLVADKRERTHEIQATGATHDKAARRG